MSKDARRKTLAKKQAGKVQFDRHMASENILDKKILQQLVYIDNISLTNSTLTLNITGIETVDSGQGLLSENSYEIVFDGIVEFALESEAPITDGTFDIIDVEFNNYNSRLASGWKGFGFKISSPESYSFIKFESVLHYLFAGFNKVNIRILSKRSFIESR